MEVIPLSPDGHFYLAMARRELVPMPYARRWFVPWWFGPHPRKIAAFTYASLAATPIAAFCYFGAMGLDGYEQWFASALLCVLPGMSRCSLRFPVLVDAPAMLFALMAAWLTKIGAWPLAVFVALLGGATKETVPVFAACWCWHPLPLVGLLAVGWWRKAAPLGPDAPDWLTHPVRAAVKLRLAIGLDGSLYLRPFGAALAGLVAPSWQMMVTIALAVAQMFCAQDTIRLLVWCAPPLVLSAAHHIPIGWMPIALLWTAMQRDDRV